MERGVAGRALVIIIGLVLLVCVAPLVYAHLGTPIDSGWASTTPTINGVIAVGEWSDATVRDFTLEMRDRTVGDLNRTLNGRLYVKNDWTRLFAAVQIFNDDYEAQDFAGKWNGFGILFDDLMDGSLTAGDNGEGVTTWVGSPFYNYNDLYYDGAGTWTADFYAGKTNDGSMGWSHTNPIQGAIGNWTFEMMIPLVGSDGDSYDFDITILPKTVGYKLWFQEPSKGLDGVYPDDPAISKSINEVTNGATFGDLTLHPLYNLTLIAGTGGTTNPVPGVYQYPYMTVVNASAVADAWFEFDHWEFDSINVGTANPYSVTMDQNHTLKAFFHPLYELKIQTTTGGTTTPAPNAYIYPNGTLVSVSATQSSGHQFDHWELDTVEVSTANAYNVLMNMNHTLKAVFVPDLAVSITPTDITINLGNSVSFSSSVVGGTTPYSYQWYVGGNPVSGATSSSWMYTPPAVGIYYVQLKVTDFRGRFAMSNTARVVVQSIPVGGYSISQGKPASLPPIAFYTFLLCALGTMISLMRCKRSTRIPLRREVF